MGGKLEKEKGFSFLKKEHFHQLPIRITSHFAKVERDISMQKVESKGKQ